MRKIIIAGNWKMYKNISEAVEFASGLKRELYDLDLDTARIEIVVCPVFTALYSVGEGIFNSEIKLGAQDVFWEEQGPFTGEVSPLQLKDLGVKYVIVGHSERRQYFFETNERVNKKIKAVLKNGLTPIVCIGETLKERENNLTFSILEEQIKGAFKNVSLEEIIRCVIAYEPVWAIGTGRNATSTQAEEAQNYIRRLLSLSLIHI
ncbi:MAG: triose-phosphate isomerase, partial [Candidatus Omnitrophica bacterium]|nr:triose-phosphate isomerase [Candidatus Omnitrophota bacterium]